MYIVLSGLIGAGKSTLLDNMGVTISYPEPVQENPYLDDFYRDPKAFAYIMQKYILEYRINQQMFAHEDLEESDYKVPIHYIENGNSKTSHIKIIQDRCIVDDYVFASVAYSNGLMTNKQFKLYKKIGRKGTKKIKKFPNLIVFIDVPIETLLDRIKMRGRECEQGITAKYLTQLRNKYMEVLSPLKNVIYIKTDDYVTPNILKKNISDFLSNS